MKRVGADDADVQFGTTLYSQVAPGLDVSFFAPLWHLIGLSHLVSTDLNRITGRHDLSIADLLLLGTLRIARRPLRPTDLSDQLHVSNAALTSRIARLLRAKLVERVSRMSDLRAYDLVLTPEGEKRADAAITEIGEQGHFARHFSRLDGADREAITRALGKLHDMVDREFLTSYGSAR